MFGYIVLLVSLGLAGFAAWFAVAGIMAFYAGAPLAALGMGVVIELGKLVGVSWLYRNWSQKTWIKWGLLPMVLTAMLMTSAGIFGFLSKAHLEQNAPAMGNELKVERIDQRIAREQKKIDDAEVVIGQLDETVQKLINYDRIRGPDGAKATREGQQEQRDALASTIEEAQTNIDTLSDERLELAQELQALELELGPIKYVAALIYEDAESNIEQAAQILTLFFIFIFDPLAIMLLMAANHTIMKGKEETDIEPDIPAIEPDIKPDTDEDISSEDVVDMPDTEESQPAIEPARVEQNTQLLQELAGHLASLNDRIDGLEDSNKNPRSSVVDQMRNQNT